MAKSPKKHIQFLSPENYIRQKARNLPIYKCLINTNWKREGMAQIAIARQHTNGNLTFGLYMVDLFCLGVRDTFYGFNRPETEFDDLVSKMTDGLEMTSVDYVLIHNIIYAAIEYAEELGFNPHKDYKSITQYILEEDTDEIALMEIECGKNGKPLFIKSGSFTEAQSKSIINQLEKAVGPGNYDVISGYLYDDEDGIDEEDEDLDLEYDYALIKKHESMSPSERKKLFLELTKNDPTELSENEFRELHMLTQTIYLYDVSDEIRVEQYFKDQKIEYETLIDEEDYTPESIGIEIDKFTPDELDWFTIELDELIQNESKKKKDFGLLRDNWGNLPIICYQELIWMQEYDPKNYSKKLHEYITLFPEYPLIKIHKLKTDIIYNDKYPTIEELRFESFFKNRDSITEYEMFEYQILKILLLNVITDDIINKAEAQRLVMGAIDINKGYLHSLEALFSITRVKILSDHFHQAPERKLFVSKKKSDKAFQFKIQLANIKDPLVWRRILMPANATFVDFHDAIQIAFGWEDYHLFMFSPKGFGSSPVIELKNEDDDFDNPFSRFPEEKLDAETLTLSEIFNNEKQTYTYIYDFGDNWEHKITLEAILHQSIDTPVLLKGKGACPPEDCGSAWGYENLKVVMADKKHPEHKEMREWLGLERGEKWDAEEFDLQSHQEDMEFFFSDEP